MSWYFLNFSSVIVTTPVYFLKHKTISYLTFKVLSKIVVVNILKFFYHFSEKIRYAISCELSASRQFTRNGKLIFLCKIQNENHNAIWCNWDYPFIGFNMVKCATSHDMSHDKVHIIKLHNKVQSYWYKYKLVWQPVTSGFNMLLAVTELGTRSLWSPDKVIL